MKRRFVLLLALFSIRAVPQCPVTPQDATPFLKAKVAIAQRVLKQMKARDEVCDHQPESKKDLCEEWAKASNEAVKDVQATAFAEIDKLMAAKPH